MEDNCVDTKEYVEKACEKLNLKDSEEGKIILKYIEDLEYTLKVWQKGYYEAKNDEESTIEKANEQIDKLEEELYIAEEKCGELFAGFFMHVRSKIIEPKGLELGKTQKEITQMTLETIDLYLKEKVDYAEVERLIEEADMNETEGGHIPRVD